MTMHLHQTNHNNKGGVHPKQRMAYEEKKTEQTKEEEEINRGKVGILKFMLGVEEFLLGARKNPTLPTIV